MSHHEGGDEYSEEQDYKWQDSNKVWIEADEGIDCQEGQGMRRCPP